MNEPMLTINRRVNYKPLHGFYRVIAPFHDVLLKIWGRVGMLTFYWNCRF